MKRNHLLNLIAIYNQQTLALADALNAAKKQYGRKDLLKVLPISATRLDYLCGIAEVKYRFLSCEHMAEVVHVIQKTKWLKRAKKEGWSALELRKQIRASQKSIVAPVTQKRLPQWSRNIMLATQELNRSKDINIDAAKELVSKLQQVIESKWKQ
jgi:hypothetical protein